MRQQAQWVRTGAQRATTATCLHQTAARVQGIHANKAKARNTRLLSSCGSARILLHATAARRVGLLQRIKQSNPRETLFHARHAIIPQLV